MRFLSVPGRDWTQKVIANNDLQFHRLHSHPACWLANRKKIISCDRDETMPTAQSFLRMVTGNRVYFRSMMPPLPAVRHAEHTIRLRDYAL